MLAARQYIVRGRVQGVGYRYFACRAAADCGVRGYVRNLGDGSVEAYAVGSEAELAAFRDLLREGPGHGLVRDVTATPAAVDERLNDFTVRF